MNRILSFQNIICNNFVRKILAPIQIKSALPPPKKKPKYPPPKTRNFMDMAFSCRKSAFFKAHKIGAAISGPRIADKNYMDARIFLKFRLQWHCDLKSLRLRFCSLGIWAVTLAPNPSPNLTGNPNPNFLFRQSQATSEPIVGNGPAIRCCWAASNELGNIYHHHPESKKKKSSEGKSSFIHPYGRYGNAVKN